MIAACSAAPTSSQAVITELTVTINGSDYPITFDENRSSTVPIPAAETIPSKITVKSAVISEKADGLQASDELAVTNNQASITITAEDGTRVSYTLLLTIMPLKVTAEEISKRVTADVRDSYVLFAIEANKDLSNYHLAVKETSEAVPPTAAEMTDGALKRNIGTNPINVLIAQRLNAPMVTFAKQYFADTTHQTLGTDMLKSLRPSHNSGLIYDGNAAGTEAWVKESTLKALTGYTLYGMEEGGNQVDALQTFMTDDTLGIPTTGPEISHADSTLEEGHIEIAINANELYIFPLQVQLNAPPITYLQLHFSHKISANMQIQIPNSVGEPGAYWGGPQDNLRYEHMLHIFKNMGSLKEVYASSAFYVLMNTAALNYDTLQYGLAYTLSGIADVPAIGHSVLVKQQ